MTAPTEQFVDAAKHSQEAVATAIATWADTMQSFASKLTSGQPPLPDLQGVVEQYFDFAAKVLAGQREFAQQWATAAQAATEQAQRATPSVTARTATAPKPPPRPPAAQPPDASQSVDDPVRSHRAGRRLSWRPEAGDAHLPAGA